MIAIETDNWRIEWTSRGWGVRHKGGWYVQPHEELTVVAAIFAMKKFYFDPTNPDGWYGGVE